MFLQKHGLKVHVRDPSSYTPIKESYQKKGGPTSLTLSSCPEKNFKEIAKFSIKDAQVSNVINLHIPLKTNSVLKNYDN